MIINSYVLGGASYILNDAFTTNASAPLTTPRTAEPGPAGARAHRARRGRRVGRVPGGQLGRGRGGDAQRREAGGAADELARLRVVGGQLRTTDVAREYDHLRASP